MQGSRFAAVAHIEVAAITIASVVPPVGARNEHRDRAGHTASPPSRAGTHPGPAGDDILRRVAELSSSAVIEVGSPEWPELGSGSGPLAGDVSSAPGAGVAADESLVPHDLVPHDLVPHDLVPHDLVPHDSLAASDTLFRRDGGRTVPLGLDPGLDARSDGTVTARPGPGAVFPVFGSDGDGLMTLPGCALVVLDPHRDSHRVRSFFAANGITQDRLSRLGYAADGFLVDTGPDFASLRSRPRMRPCC